VYVHLTKSIIYYIQRLVADGRPVHESIIIGNCNGQGVVQRLVEEGRPVHVSIYFNVMDRV